ncbi:response regulator transcription factor [Actinomycetospora sp. CA-084318]|uniref:response regulator transcription factor n=1 Tax=Actinomycetospora sp. CA-084318 TaxID=3239892 RepID=UPI003D95C3CF
MTRLLLVDDDELVRAGLRMILEAEPDLEVVAETGDGVDVTSLARRFAVDVVIMDVRMPRVDGLTATRHLVQSLADPPRVLVLTTFGQEEAVYEALRAGAAGFLVKRARPAEIVAAVRTVALGDTLLFPEAVRDLARRRAPAARPALPALTDRETEVLRHLARGATNAEIAAALVVGTETVKTHVAAVLGKLGARDRTQAVVLAYESGFVVPGL